MKLIAPCYYPEFHCIADQCRHTCCVGWEIDIDPCALARYQSAPGALGEKLRQNIVSDECPHFRLTRDERCPFLNAQNLCELILESGEDALCQICTDHPRFRNHFAFHTEIGLGLCCEAACSLILGRTEKTHLIVLKDDDAPCGTDDFESLILSVRSAAFETACDRSLPFSARLDALQAQFDVHMPQKSDAEWAQFFLSLEQLDDSWGQLLRAMRDAPFESGCSLTALELPFEQLLIYFLYRHLPSAQDEIDIKGCIGFALLGCRMLQSLCRAAARSGECRCADLAELARLYSSEIEYSPENTNAILNLLWEENAKYSV